MNIFVTMHIFGGEVQKNILMLLKQYDWALEFSDYKVRALQLVPGISLLTA